MLRIFLHDISKRDRRWSNEFRSLTLSLRTPTFYPMSMISPEWSSNLEENLSNRYFKSFPSFLFCAIKSLSDLRRSAIAWKMSSQKSEDNGPLLDVLVVKRLVVGETYFFYELVGMVFMKSWRLLVSGETTIETWRVGKNKLRGVWGPGTDYVPNSNLHRLNRSFSTRRLGGCLRAWRGEANSITVSEQMNKLT